MARDGTGRDGMGWDGTGWDVMGRDGWMDDWRDRGRDIYMHACVYVMYL